MGNFLKMEKSIFKNEIVQAFFEFFFQISTLGFFTVRTQKMYNFNIATS